MRWMTGTGARVAVTPLLGLFLAAGLAAQETGSRGWLGVAVYPVLECQVRSPVRDRCSSISKKLVVAQVVVDGPADRAGVQVGDTLVALGGERLDPGLTDEAFAELRPGVPARLEVGRADARTTLRVVPAERPSGPVAVRVAVAPGRTGVLWRPSVAPPAPPVPGEIERRLLIRGQAGGVYQVQPHIEVTAQGAEGGERRSLLVVPERRDASPQDAAELERRLRVGRPPDYTAGGSVGYVQLDPGPELRALQDSVFRTARQHLDSLRRRLAAANEDRYGTFIERVRVEGPDRLAPLAFGLGRSVAGAEFEPLSRELAEFFEGADEGLLCLRVVSDTPADRLGLRPGDVVVAVAGRPVTGVDEFRAALWRAGARPIEVRWVRKGQAMRGALREE